MSSSPRPPLVFFAVNCVHCCPVGADGIKRQTPLSSVAAQTCPCRSPVRAVTKPPCLPLSQGTARSWGRRSMAGQDKAEG